MRIPLLADITKTISADYGVLLTDGEDAGVSLRGLFIIDPKNTVRALIYYPLNVGRNVDEVLRTLTALQTADANGVACPVNWTPGQKVIVPPPKTVADVAQRIAWATPALDPTATAAPPAPRSSASCP